MLTSEPMQEGFSVYPNEDPKLRLLHFCRGRVGSCNESTFDTLGQVVQQGMLGQFGDTPIEHTTTALGQMVPRPMSDFIEDWRAIATANQLGMARAHEKEQEQGDTAAAGEADDEAHEPPPLAQRCPGVDHVSMANLSAGEFLSKYAKRSLPLVVSDAAAGWRATSEWVGAEDVETALLGLQLTMVIVPNGEFERLEKVSWWPRVNPSSDAFHLSRPFSRELVIANPARQNVPGARALRPSYVVARIRVGGTRVCG